MIISIGGFPGSGKTKVQELLAKKLHYPCFDIGGLRRKFAKERGLTIEEYNTLGMTNPSTDIEADKYQQELAKEHKNFIVCSRLGYHFLPQSFKVFLRVSAYEGARRIFLQQQADNKRNEKKFLTIEEVQHNLRQRVENDQARYQKYYQLDPYDDRQFDLVIDTTDKSPEEVVRIILSTTKEL